jgi:very-short-patch-repair endonuclease
LPYNINLKEFSRKLRKNSTLGEILLWEKLRAGNLMNHKFNRRKPLGRYIVDFYCNSLSLVIEVDGIYHHEPEQKLRDEERQQQLQQMGLHFLRFLEQQVLKDMDWVINEIRNYIVAFEEERQVSSP